MTDAAFIADPDGTDATDTAEPQVLDVNEDGVDDAIVITEGDTTAMAADTDLDGGVDTVLLDIDGDGQPDVAVAEDGAGGYVVAFDRDGDGEFEEQQQLTREELEAQLPDLAALLDTEFDTSGTSGGTEATPTSTTGAAGEPQVLDVDEDGVAETLVISGPDGTTAAVVDTDADSDADTLLVDVDGDGQPDLAVAEDGAGGYVVALDRDGDGEFEEEQAVSRTQLESELPEVAALLDVRFDGQSGSTTGDTPVSETGTPDSQLVDVNEDGQDDAVVITDGTSTVVAADTEGDQEVDTVFIDLDNDGEFEAAVTEDGKGGFIVGFDNDGDGEYEEQQALTREELVAELPQIAELLDITLDEASGETGGGTSPERAELVPEA
jgi:hypothetical protein